MDFTEYQRRAATTKGTHPNRESALSNWALGLGEVGEVQNLVKKYLYHGHSCDPSARIIDELGDVLWYMAALAGDLGYSLDTVAEMNLDKLAKRYPNGFSPDASRNRSI